MAHKDRSPHPKTEGPSPASEPQSSEPTTDVSEQERQRESDMDRLAQLLESLGADVGGGFTAYIDRISRPGVPLDVAGYIGPMEFTPTFLDDVMAVHGGGKYRARIQNARGKYRTSFTFTIAGQPKIMGAAAASGGAPSAESLGPHSRIERLVGELVTELRESRQRPATSSLGEVIQIAEALKALAPAPAPPAPAITPKDMLETIETVLDIRERVADTVPTNGRGGASEFAGVVEHGVKPLVNLGNRYLELQERAMELRAQGKLSPRPASPANTAAPASPVVSPPRPTVPRAPAASTAEPLDPVVELARAIPRGARAFLAAQARADRDEATYAIMALDTLNDAEPALYDALPTLLARDDFAQLMCDNIPEWGGHREWFTAMFDLMREQLGESDDAGGDAGTEAAPDAGTHVEAPARPPATGDRAA